MPAPLLVVDTPSLLYRAFFALPKSINGSDGRSVNALLGTANLLLQVVEAHEPRATVLCFGAEAAAYRTALYPAYHAARPPMPDELVHQWEDAPAFFDAFGWPSLNAGELEADDLLGSLAALETRSGGGSMLFTGDRDMFQCADALTTILFPAKGGPEQIGPDGVRARYGIEPAQVPDLIALRGDPSDGLPGARGIGAKGAAELLGAYGTLDGVLAAAADPRSDLSPRRRAALLDDAKQLRAFLDIATLRTIDVGRPADRALDRAGAASAAAERGMGRLAERLRA